MHGVTMTPSSYKIKSVVAPTISPTNYTLFDEDGRRSPPTFEDSLDRLPCKRAFHAAHYFFTHSLVGGADNVVQDVLFKCVTRAAKQIDIV